MWELISPLLLILTPIKNILCSLFRPSAVSHAEIYRIILNHYNSSSLLQKVDSITLPLAVNSFISLSILLSKLSVLGVVFFSLTSPLFDCSIMQTYPFAKQIKLHLGLSQCNVTTRFVNYYLKDLVIPWLQTLFDPNFMWWIKMIPIFHQTFNSASRIEGLFYAWVIFY